MCKSGDWQALEEKQERRGILVWLAQAALIEEASILFMYSVRLCTSQY